MEIEDGGHVLNREQDMESRDQSEAATYIHYRYLFHTALMTGVDCVVFEQCYIKRQL